MSICSFDQCCICVFVFVYLQVRHPGTLFMRPSYHYIFKNIAHVMSICKFDQCCICIFVYFCLCICKSDTQKFIFEVLLQLPFQKYSTCHVCLQLWPMLYLHHFWGPCIITFQKIYGLYGLKHRVEIRGGVTRRDDDDKRQWKIALLSLWAVGRPSFAISSL